MDLLRKPTTSWAIATLILTAVVFGVVVEIISWEQLSKVLVTTIIIVGVLVSLSLYIYGYIRYRKQKAEVKRDTLANRSKSDSARPGIGIIDNLFGAEAHKCTNCGWSFRITKLDKLAYCPKCESVDEI